MKIEINIELMDTLWLSQKINPILWRFEGNPLRINSDIDENVQFCSQHRVVTPCCDRVQKLTLLCGGLETIY